MDSRNSEISVDFPPFFKVYKDGRVERYGILDGDAKYAPVGVDPKTGVQSKDLLVSPETGVKARIFLPKIDRPGKKFPLLVHYHGGGFCVGSPFDTISKNFLTSMVTQANVIAISIDYRLGPEHSLPIAHDDSWAGLQWVSTHSNGLGPEPWLNEYADFGRVFLVGESAGANIAHYVAIQAGINGVAGLKIIGVIVVHAYFGGKELDKMIQYLYPTSRGCDDPILNPEVDPNLKTMGCDRVLVCVAEEDSIRNRGEAYYQTLAKSEWGGKVEFYETLGENHCFHLFNPNGENVGPLLKKMADFINQE